MWLYILYGVIASQLIAFIAFVVSGEKEEVGIFAGCGLVMGPAMALMRILRAVRKIYIRKAYILVQAEYGGMFKRTVRIKKQWYNNYYHEGEGQYFIMPYTGEGKNTENAESLRNVQTNGWWNNDWIRENLMKS